MFKHGPAMLLAAISAVLLAALGWFWLGPGRTSWQPPPPVKPNLAGDAVTGIDPPRVEPAQLTAISERPVFSVLRRPMTPASAVGALKVESIDSVQLLGLMTGGSGASALIRGEDGKTRRLAVSDSVGDWRLREVRGSSAVFIRGAEIRTVALKPSRFAAAAGGAGAAAPPPAAGAASTTGTGMFSQPATPFGAPTPTASVPTAGTRNFPALPPPVPVAAGGTPSRPVPDAPANAFVIGGQRR